MKSIYQEAMDLKEELIANRRTLHQIPEVGLELPQTSAFIAAKLEEIGIPCKISEKNSHVTAMLGSGDPNEACILLRSDMDALPGTEESGLDFASTNGCMHACAHDIHAASLLGAAKILKAHEEELDGTVKFLFQSGEEVFHGAETAIREGILQNPPVQAAFAMHMFSFVPFGTISYHYHPMASVYGFRITVKGKGAHGSAPEASVSPINAAVQIYQGLQELIAREIPGSKEVVLTIGKFESGSAANVIPAEAVMEGTLRAFDNDIREFMIRRITEVAEGIALAYRATAEVTKLSDCPALVNDPELTEEILGYIRDEREDLVITDDYHALGSEDFAFFSQEVPSCYLPLGGTYGNGYPVYYEHNPKIRYSEDNLPTAAGTYALTALKWLENHREK